MDAPVTSYSLTTQIMLKDRLLPKANLTSTNWTFRKVKLFHLFPDILVDSLTNIIKFNYIRQILQEIQLISIYFFNFNRKALFVFVDFLKVVIVSHKPINLIIKLVNTIWYSLETL